MTMLGVKESRFSLHDVDANQHAGLGVLFSKLQQGVMEDRQILTLARLRAEAEDVYGQRLADIAPAADRVSGGFSRDDGATIRKVCYAQLN